MNGDYISKECKNCIVIAYLKELLEDMNRACTLAELLEEKIMKSLEEE